VITLGICSNSRSSSKSASSSHHQQTGSFQSHQQTTGEDYIWNTKKWGWSRLKQHNFVILEIIQQSSVIKCIALFTDTNTTLLLNCYVKFCAKSARIAKISPKVREAYFLLDHSLHTHTHHVHFKIELKFFTRTVLPVYAVAEQQCLA